MEVKLAGEANWTFVDVSDLMVYPVLSLGVVHVIAVPQQRAESASLLQGTVSQTYPLTLGRSTTLPVPQTLATSVMVSHVTAEAQHVFMSAVARPAAASE